MLKVQCQPNPIVILHSNLFDDKGLLKRTVWLLKNEATVSCLGRKQAGISKAREQKVPLKCRKDENDSKCHGGSSAGLISRIIRFGGSCQR